MPHSYTRWKRAFAAAVLIGLTCVSPLPAEPTGAPNPLPISSPDRMSLISNSEPTTTLWYRQPADAWIKTLNQLRPTEQLRTVMAGAGGTYPNLFDAHPPFQIDGNFGFVAGLNEMLLQSHERYTDPAAPQQDRYVIDLLPALPSAWPDGSVSGLRARGGFEVALQWRNGQLSGGTIRSVGGTTARARYGTAIIDLEMSAGESRQLKTLFAP